MKNLSAICISALSLALAACGHSHGHEGHDHDHDHEHENHDHGQETEAVHHDHADDDIILEPDMASRFGVRTDTVRVAMYSESIKGAGTFISSSSSIADVTAPISGIVSYSRSVTVGAKVKAGATVATVRPGRVEGGSANAAARAAMLAAKREMDRLKPLYDDHLVTAAEYNAAVAAYEAAAAAYSPGATGAASSPISGVVTSVSVASGAYVEAGAMLLQVSSGDDLTLRVDVPHSRYATARNATDANIRMSDGRTIRLSDAGGRRISAAEAGATAANGFVAVYFSVPASVAVAPGATAEVYLLGESSGECITIPRTALREQQGRFFV